MPSTPRPEPLVRVPDTFDAEFPDASRRATETFLNIGILAGTVRSAVEVVVAAEGVPSMAAFNVLSVLGGDAQPLRPSVIAERMMVTRATITGVLDSLEARGLVRRVVNRNDNRSRDVTLTAAGRRVVDRLVPRLHEVERDLMGVLSDAELGRLLDVIARLQRRILEMVPAVRSGIR